MSDCKKKKFTYEEAEKALLEISIEKLNNFNRKEKRKYKCKKCGAWHLTSKDIDQNKISLNIKNMKKRIGWVAYSYLKKNGINIEK